MHVEIIVDGQRMQITLDQGQIEQAAPLLAKMDRDMDQGWQVGPKFVGNPGRLERCQIAADRILTALHQENEATVHLMCAYIVSRMPGTVSMDIDTSGEPENTRFFGPETEAEV